MDGGPPVRFAMNLRDALNRASDETGDVYSQELIERLVVKHGETVELELSEAEYQSLGGGRFGMSMHARLRFPESGKERDSPCT
jgi:hypothetical protein